MKNHLTRILLPADNHPIKSSIPVFRRYPNDAGDIHAMIENYVLEEICNEIENLSEPCKAVFELTFFHDLDTAQVADRLDMSIKAVLQYKQQALMVLRITALKQCLLETPGQPGNENEQRSLRQVSLDNDASEQGAYH